MKTLRTENGVLRRHILRLSETLSETTLKLNTVANELKKKNNTGKVVFGESVTRNTARPARTRSASTRRGDANQRFAMTHKSRRDSFSITSSNFYKHPGQQDGRGVHAKTKSAGVFRFDGFSSDDESRGVRSARVKKFLSITSKNNQAWSAKHLTEFLSTKNITVELVKKLKSNYESHHSSFFIELCDIDSDKLYDADVWKGIEVNVLVKNFVGYPRDSNFCDEYPCTTRSTL